MSSTPPAFRVTGTEYERLLASLRLKSPWALQGHAPAAVPEVLDGLGQSSRVDPGPWRSVVEVIVAQCRLHADRVALSDGSTETTYGRLEERTRALAADLRARGIGRGDVVALVLERGPGFVELALAVWRVGAAYLPLSPSHPQAWREDIVRRAGVVLVVALAPDSAVPGVPFLAAGAEAVSVAAAEQDAVLAPEDLAYIICTSGSTGEPKLVMIEHRGVANLLHAQRDFLGALGPDTRVLQFFHPSFDASLFDLLLALSNGGRLETVEAAQFSGEPLAQVLVRRRITHAVLPAAVLRTLQPGGFPDLQVVMSVGDVCLPETARQWGARHRFVNGYGPTEVTVASTLQAVGAVDGERVPIGRPISNYHVVLLDEHLRPVPEGAPGELCLGGEGVGRGYLGRPALTAERFIPDPFSGQPGSRLYRSGDLGRRLPDGTLEFLGRRDDQVKIRGARIELGQVETALAALPDVRDAVALVDGTGERLLGYVMPVAGAVLSGDAVSAELRRRLPGYLVPDAVVVVDAWPLNTNGKVDRARLPRPQRTERAGYQPPESPGEEALAAIAAGLLGMERVGRHDNLFELGGHSLFATQLVARVRRVLGAQLELSAVLQSPTVAQLAAGLKEGQGGVEQGPRAGAAGTALMPSYGQERVWLMHKLNPDARAYHSQSVFRLVGALDVNALHACLTDIVRRHDVMRTRFPEVDGELRCELEAPWEVEVPLQDFSDVDEALLGARVGEAVRDAVQAPFALAEGRPFRWRLLRLGAEEHVFVHVEHHIVHDGWSFNVFVRELINGYAESVRHGQVRRPALAVQYNDYARWQREWVGTEAAQAQRRFWRQELEGAETRLQLPRRASPGGRRFRGVAPRMELDGDLARRLQALADRNNTSLFTTLLAAYFVLLHRYTGSQDLLVGSSVANRRWQDTEGLLGMLINTVVLRGRLHGHPSFEEFLARMRRTTLDVYDHQELPYEQIFAESPARHQGGFNPLMQTMFNFHDSSVGTLDASPLDVTYVEGLGNGSSKFELAVVAVPLYSEPGHIRRLAGDLVSIPRSDTPVRSSPRASLSGILLSWEFDSDLFEGFFITGMLSAYQQLLRSITAAPDTRVSRLALMTEAEQRALVSVGPRQEAPAHWVPDLLARWTRLAPEAPAVTSGTSVLTYGELTRQAEHLAHHLRGLGVGRESLVAVCIPRSAELVVAQLGILKAGAAFLSLDPGAPPAYLEPLVQDAGARALVTTAALAGRLSGLPVIVLDDLPPVSGPPLPSGSPSDLAYVLYTSGSTGKPKGVQIEHRSVASLLHRTALAEDLGPGKTMMAMASVSFDVSVLEVWAALLNGAAVHFLPPGWDVPGLARCLIDQRITHAVIPPVVLPRLVAEAPEAFAGLDRVVVGGDVFPVEAFHALKREGFTKVTNAYGPTEITIMASAFKLDDWQDTEATNAPIGRALFNAHLVVLDERGQVAPPGAVGEICIGGDGVARGYRHRPGLTAERFVPDPFAAHPGGRLYRSGDLGRWLPGGVIEFLGRRDEQVKVRGFRVELAEVRAALAAHPGVVDTLAVVDSRGEEPRLVGYVVAEAGTPVSAQAVREDLARRLPGHLVPSEVVVLEAWPLTPHGKVDRARLPATQRSPDAPFTAPRTESEVRIAAVVADLLGVARVDVHESLLALGMHSLQAMRLASRLGRMVGREVGLATILMGPTVAQLAAALPASPVAATTIKRLPRA
ncbi:amino acid adenylation domain-containing protein [Corallococcus praedator]|uniref:Amino acid adenylation domain-containing protein n=1 Tax=Corallococcus praedator TaxID=2316724 RepID=A0ABX9QSW1_9BACT|nr:MULTISPECIES: non-ribosomal peptide synthetase [Corallococcus]RKH35906.1 amino acid adenylation domain-containing protein [Corallococcus sp. CA031C]RKI17630.1 amino acid adenylation domain-containing protein [Corallococcus praedator]